jgi:hypothetical protein
VLYHYKCACNLEQQITFDAEGFARHTRLRISGVWMEALQIARLVAPLIECPTCEGDPGYLGVCRMCMNMGVVRSDGSAFQLPDFKQVDVPAGSLPAPG